MLNVVLILLGNEVLESSSDPLVSVHLFGLLFVIHGNPVVVFEIVLELVGFLELFEEKLMKLVLAWAVLGIHALKHPVKQLQESLNLTVAEPLDLHQVGHVKVTF